MSTFIDIRNVNIVYLLISPLLSLTTSRVQISFRIIDVQNVAVHVEISAFIVDHRRRKPTFHCWHDSASLLTADAEDLSFVAGNLCLELFPHFAQ